MKLSNKLYNYNFRWFPFILAITIFTFCSCSDDDNTTPTLSEEYITISPHINAGTTRVVGNSFEANDAIGLYVVSYADDNTTPGSIVNPDAANAEHIYQESSWLLPSGGKLSWPTTTNSVDLYAYYPYDQALDDLNPTQYNFSVSSDQRTKAEYERSDFLWAKTENVLPTPQPVDLTFSHRLSKVKINVRSEIDLIQEDVRNSIVTLLNVVSGGTINLADGSTTVPAVATRSDIRTYQHITPDLNYLLSTEAIIMPQEIPQGQVLLRIDLPTNGTRYNYEPLTNITFDPGTERTINITITRLGLTVLVSEISDWQPSEIIEGEIGTRLNRVVDLSNIDWNSSYIHHIYSDGQWVGDVCREYLRTNGSGIDAQALVIYLVNDQGSIDVSTGYVAQVMSYNSTNYQYTPSASNIHGGRVNWNTDGSISSYVAGNIAAVNRVLLNMDGTLEPAPDDDPVNMRTTPYLLKDIDNNSYALVKVGGQFWMKENLSVTRYNNGESLNAYIYNSVPELGDQFGRLYTWDTATNPNGIAPDGWRLPAYSDFVSLNNYAAGYPAWKLKAPVNWYAYGTNSINITGFSGMGSGIRTNNGGYQSIYTYGYWWTTTPNGSNAQVVGIYSGSYSLQIPTYSAAYGLSIRLVRE